MQKRTNTTTKKWKERLLSLLCILLLLSLLPVMEHTQYAHAYTAAQRPGLQPSDISVSRERILRSAKAHIDRANQTGYAYNNVLRGTEYIPLATSTQGFCCVDLVTHVLYTATASKINGEYSSLQNTLTTRHTFASSNGIVFETSGVGVFRQQLTAIPQLYTRHLAPVDKTQLRLGDIVISGDQDSMYNPGSSGANTHATLVIGKVTPAENAYLQIPNYNPDTSYFITMSSSRGAEWVSTNWYNRAWSSGDPNKGYFISNMFRMNWEPPQQDKGGFRIKKADSTTGAGLPGAEFNLQYPGGYIEAIVMTSSEYISPKEYEPGTYTLTETKAPDGYTLDPTPRTIEIRMDEINSVYWNTPIPNEPSDGYVQVTKKDAVTGANIAGAVFDLSQSSTFPASGTIRLTTRADGTTVPQQFGIGDGTTVYVREVSVPAPYLHDSTVKQVTLRTGQTVGVTFENHRAQGRLEIVKQGKNNKPIQNAVFEVRNAANTLVATLTTDAEGKAQTGLLPLGTYTLTETSVPSPYVLDPTPITMTLTYKDMNTPVVVEARTISNVVAQGRIEIIKHGENNAPVQGAVFEVRNTVNTLVATLTTDAQGKASTGSLPLGTYTVTETFVPAPYILDPTPITITLAYKDMNTPIVVEARTVNNDAAQGRLEITKQGENNVLIQGAVFQVRNAANTLIATLTTDTDGKAQTGLLPLGTYTVTETFVPSPYILDPTPITMTLAYKDMNTPIIVEARTISNIAAEGRIKIVKKDSISQEMLAGAIFEIRNNSNAVVDTITTDANGVATSKNLPLGAYTVKEKTPPQGYLPNETVYDVTLTYQDMNTPIVEVEMTIENEPIRGRVRIIKLAKGDAIPIEGATFELFNPDDTPAVDLYGHPVGTLTTDSDGMALTPYLRFGTYILRETSAPDEFYINDDDFEVKIIRNEKIVNQYVRNERIMLRLRIIKSDSVTDEPLQGAEFQIYDSDGDLVTFTVIIDGRPVIIDRLVTNDDGIAISAGGLPIGTYTLREVKAPDGYASIDDLTFEITRDTNYVEIPLVGKVLDESIGNAPTVIELSKKKITGDGELPGAHLKVIEKESGAVVEEWVSTDTPHVIQKLKVGVTYILRETLSPAGYTIATDIEFTVLDTGEVQPVVMRNKLTHVEIHKKDNVTGDALQGVEFLIQDKDGNAQRFIYDTSLNAYVWEELAHTGNSSVLTTDAAGTILIYGLPIGEYELSETKESPGYKRLRNPIAFTVNDNSDDTSPVVIDLENEMNEVTLEKTDLVTGNPVVGAVIQIFNEAGELVREVTTDENGQALIKGLPAGTYTFREVLAPEGYILNEKTFTFSIDPYGEVSGVTKFTNEPTQFLLYKRDADDDAMLLEGAVFELYRLRDGEEPEMVRFRLEDGLYIASADGEITKLTTDELGMLQVLTLPYGDYCLLEVEAPVGYALDPTSYDFTLDEEVGVIEYDAMNAQTEVTLEKTDLATGEAVPGAVIQIFDEVGDLVREVTTDENGQALIKGLPVGTYTFKEILAPDGYVLNEETFTFTIDEMGNVTGVTEFTNEPTSLSIYKVDANDLDKPLEGVEFELYRLRDGEEPELMRFRLEDGVYIADADGDITTLTTDDTGTIRMLRLPYGDYRLMETKTIPGYVLNPNGIEMTLDEEQYILGIVVENGETVVTLEKTDIVTGEPVAGAIIEVYDETGELVRSVETDSRGLATLIGLPAGTYTFREVLAPDGYVLNEATFTFTIDTWGNVTGVTEFTNEPTSLTIEKEDATTGKRLEGAVFELYRLRDGEEPEQMRFRLEDGVYIADANGDLTSVVSNAKGTITILRLPYGDYRLVETKAPKGYDLNEKATDVTLTEEAEVLIVTVQNKETTPPAKTGEAFPLYAFPFLGLAAVLMAIVLILRKKREKELQED